MADLGTTEKATSRRDSYSWFFLLLLALVLLAGAYLRTAGLFWGEYTYLHPDERFLLWVGSDIAPVESFQEYWDTQTSSLNPHNRNHGFYVYGTLPMFLARYIVEWVYGRSGFMEMLHAGRSLSAFFDLGTALMVYLVAAQLYDRRVGLLAAGFSAFAVLPIQQSHFFTMDTFTTFFSVLVLYFAVRAVKAGAGRERDEGRFEHEDVRFALGADVTTESPGQAARNASSSSATGLSERVRPLIAHPLFTVSLGFGVALGMAAASKINAAPLAFLLPAALLIRLAGTPEEDRKRQFFEAAGYVIFAAFVSLLVFRVFQPYAFSGPGFFGLRPNLAWIDNLRSLASQTGGDVDFPPAMQWARRPVWFAWQNMVLWGMGLPLGLAAWAGFLAAGWDMFKGNWRKHALLWAWTALYFTWQSLVFNPSMRYQLLVYPTLIIFAAWGIVRLYDRGRRRAYRPQFDSDRPGLIEVSAHAVPGRQSISILATIIGFLVLFGTAAYAFAFTSIYTRPMTRVEASRWIYANIPGPINLRIQTDGGLYNQPLPFPYEYAIRPELPFLTQFRPQVDGSLAEIYLAHVFDQEAPDELAADPTATEATRLQLLLSDQPDLSAPIAAAVVTVELSGETTPASASASFLFEQPVSLSREKTYYLEIVLQSESGAVQLKGTAIANEGSWDDGLPVRLDGYDAFGGIYQPGLNFDMYETDSPNKLARFLGILDQSEYLLISSNRQWGSLPRLPERFPMTTEYYRHLLGCPSGKSIAWCYNVAQPGDFQGQLGFELVKTFHSKPTLGIFSINDQFAEEAFTVYDHPKVFIFKKTADYDPESPRRILGAVDLTKVVHVTPKKAGPLPREMMLPPERLQRQVEAGTWSQIFDSSALQNRSPVFGLALWYLAVAFLGVLAYPILRVALPGLSDRGYPLARTAGLLIVSYLTWLAGSFNISFTRLTISLVVAVLAFAAVYLVYRHRSDLRQELSTRGRYFLLIEGLFLAFFVFGLLLRLGNPDLWHPWKGGEKPMDFSYFNAVLKSNAFPPYDPWFAGGYINYYYYGFVLVGVLVKWLGIMPSIAFNLILPTIFSLIALGAFSVGWNLVGGKLRWPARQEAKISDEGFEKEGDAPGYFSHQFWVGLAAALGMAVLGNLGTLRMLYHGFQRLAAPGDVIEGAGILTRLAWAAQGLIRALLGAPLPYGLSDWYWLPSRAIPNPGGIEPITEFPFFTVLYADPHAHLFALPLSLLALSWAISVVLSRAWRYEHPGSPHSPRFYIALSLLLGGLAIGVLRPTNTWDLPTYLALGIVAVGYAVWRSYCPERSNFLQGIAPVRQRILVAGGGILVLVGLSLFLFQPFGTWYVQGYTAIDLWEGSRTPFWSYLTHWGLFLFVIASWMAWETRDWLANTPLSALRKLQPYRAFIQALLIGLFFAILALLFFRVAIAWLVLPLAFWAAVLLFRPGTPDTKRIVLFLVGTGLVLTLVVEVLVLRGDVERMNTVFKFYLQVWTLFAVSAAAAFGWLLAALPGWNHNWRFAWRTSLVILVAGAALYPLVGGAAKIKDRMAPNAPPRSRWNGFHAICHLSRSQYCTGLEPGLPGHPLAARKRPGFPRHR